MDRIEENLHRAAVWAFLAESLRPPGNPFATIDELPRAAGALGLDAGPVLSALANSGDLATGYDNTFGHVVRGPCPAYEAEYGEKKGMRYAHVIGDIEGYYRAFGLRPSRENRERADHAATECEFLAFLAVKAACAAELHGDEALEVCHEASRSFLGQHLGHFGRALATRLLTRSPEPFYRAVGGLLDQALAQDAVRFGVAVGLPDLPLREDAGVPEDACVQCTAPCPEAPR